MSELCIGIDVGSTTAKIAVLDADRRLVFSEYRRHLGEQARCVTDLLKLVEDRFPGADLRVAICGSGGRQIADHLGVDFVQEVVANSIAIRQLHPNARTAIELGGQDAKIIFFHFDEVSGQLFASDMRMNGVCAGGTGAFIDEIAQLLRIPVEEFNGYAERGQHVYHVSGRCGVFAKADIQPLLNQGVDKADLALSTFHAVAKQTIGGLAQGSKIKAPVVFEGGPLTFNRRLVETFAENLDLKESDVIIPERPEVIVAQGCALATLTLLVEHPRTYRAAALIQRMAEKPEHGQAEPQSAWQYFANDDEKRDFFERHKAAPPIAGIPPNRGRLDVTLGIDCGSTTSKFVFLDDDENIIACHYSNNEGAPLDVLKATLIAVRDQARALGTELNVVGVGTTGYGEELTAAAFHADHHAVETISHARAALKYQPEASFVLDIGGQDMKAIFVSHGIITGITLNEACSSGCGAFIETFAASLGVPVEEIAERAFRSEAPSDLGSRCTVFMRSRVVTEMKNGKSVDDVLAGICRSIIQNAFNKVIRLHNLQALGDHIVVQGGTFKNDAVLRALELYTGKQVTRAPHAEYMGAIGVALLTRERRQASVASTFVGLDQLESLAYREEPIDPCPCCANHCVRRLVRFADGSNYVHGNRCERGAIVGDLSDMNYRKQIQAATKRINAVPNLVEERERDLFRHYEVKKLCDERHVTIGIPRALDTWQHLPFWRGLFTSLGFTLKVSEKSSYEQFESALSTIPSDTVCFPAKLAHGHFQSLTAEGGVDRIFVPILINGLSRFKDLPIDYPCAVLGGYPLVLKTNVPTPLPVDAPAFVWKSDAMRQSQLEKYFGDTFGIDPALTRAAIGEGDRCQAEFEEAMHKRAAAVIANVAASGEFALVLCMRPYQNDPLINHHVSKYFTRLGVPVIPADALPGLEHEKFDGLQVIVDSNTQATLYAAAQIAARHPNLELAHITSFGCGHDAIISDEIQRIVQEAGKQALLLKLDESDAVGPLRIRITSFIETVRRRRLSKVPTPATPQRVLPVFRKADRRRRTILLPNLSPGFSKIVGAVANARGLNTRVLPLADQRAMELGKLHLHGDICFPAQVNVGEFLRYVESEHPKSGEIAFGLHQNCKGCRAGQYAMIARKALDLAGLADVPIVTSGDEIAELHPGFKLDVRMQYRLIYGIAVLDALDELRRSTQPYEKRPGEAQNTYDRAVEALCREVPHSSRGTFNVLRNAVAAFNLVPVDGTERRPLVMLLGEIMLAAHPTANYRLEEYLVEHGMEVSGQTFLDFFHRSFLDKVEEREHYFGEEPLVMSLVDKVTHEIIDSAFRRCERILSAYARYRPRPSTLELYQATSPFMQMIHDSGEGWLIAGDMLHGAANGIHSFVVVQPFGCLPNHVFGRGIVKLVKDRYPHIQVLSLDFDPDTSMANIENRLQMLVMNARELELRFNAKSAPPVAVSAAVG